jgi:hypothetical protein
MTNRAQLEAYAAKFGSTIRHDKEGRISRIEHGGEVYGSGCFLSLICYAERARSGKFAA